MPIKPSKCCTPYTSDCVGNAKDAHDKPDAHAIRIGHSGLAFCDAAGSSFTLTAGAGNEFQVLTSTLVEARSPVHVAFGPLMMSMTEDEAIAFGDALIQAAHRRRAAIASAKAAEAQDGAQ